MDLKEKILKVINIIIKVVIFIISFLAIFRINYYTHIYHDEFVYSSIYGTTERIQNIGDILYSSKNLYLMHNGRLITHAVMMVFLLGEKIIRDIINSCFFVLLIYLFTRFIKKNEKSYIYMIVTTILMLPMFWVTNPSFGETSIWFAGSMNYLWTTCFLIIYLMNINTIFHSENNISKKKAIGLCIFSFIISSLHEATGIIAISYTFFILAYLTIKNKKIDKTLLMILIMACIGFFSVIVSPGSNVRKMAEIQTMDHVPTIIEKIDIIKDRFWETVKLNKIMSLSIFGTIIYIAIKMITKFKETIKDKNKFEFIFYLISGGLVYAGMIVSPSFLPRVTFIPYMLFLIAFFKGLSLLKKDYIKTIIILVMIISFVKPAFESYKETNILVQIQNEAWEKRDEYIEKEIAKGNKDIVVEPLNVRVNDHMYGADLSTSLSYNHNGSMAVFYGLNSIRLESNYYIDLKLNDVNKNNTNSISLNSENKKFYLLDKEVYEKMAPYKKYKNTFMGGDIVLYFATSDLKNINIKFSEKQIVTIEEIKIYSKNEIIEIIKGKEILDKFNLENINVLEQNEKFIKLEIIENEGNLNLK